ncbi:uncharacterized protein UV8b_04506 [Ustilaginoidea virens]|uniref:Uncharacterized protein n=1 Tax=Ustilaginoidea virens TaxID=1159556 RepID=A0A063BLI5_USTVR|nr:uncharacterized protein UV8b_04506 [Ustilaginoidea virens]QUC20265.1 hypothetical protein UV8b_04506 [Ustilaginoidea virens]GAO19845.1 hypothetical protein UVI_02062930 [Ustilaginoidea virens]
MHLLRTIIALATLLVSLATAAFKPSDVIHPDDLIRYKDLMRSIFPGQTTRMRFQNNIVYVDVFSLVNKEQVVFTDGFRPSAHAITYFASEEKKALRPLRNPKQKQNLRKLNRGTVHQS